jgi:hypothetical protein
MIDTKGAVPTKCINAIVVNNTSEGTGGYVDLAGYDAALMIFDVGAALDTLSGSVYGTFSWQESDASGSGFANVAAADLLGGDNDVVIDAAAEDELVLYRTYIGSKRYVRLLVTITGTHTNGWPISGVVVKLNPRHAS